MTCRKCGTEIAAKAIICYRCGTATDEPVARKTNVGRDAKPGMTAGAKVPAYVWVILAGLVAAAAWWWLRNP